MLIYVTENIDAENKTAKLQLNLQQFDFYADKV